MKVLFAIRDDNNIVDTIVRKYQRDYGKKIVYKEVNNFTAILRELQQNNNYDRIVISDDIDEKINKSENKSKLILAKLKSIRSVALKNNKQIPIIFLSNNKKMNKYLYELNIYNGINGADITKKRIYELTIKPRNKSQAGDYYNIKDEVINKKKKISEKDNKKNVEKTMKNNEKNTVENEKRTVKSKKSKEKSINEEKNNNSVSDVEKAVKYLNQIGLDEEKYVKKFDNICSKLSKEDLKTVIKSLSLRTKKILKKNSSKYNKLTSITENDNEKTEKTKIKEDSNVKRGRGRPRKEKKEEEEPVVKRKRGRPRKTLNQTEENKTKTENKKKLEKSNKKIENENYEDDLDFEEDDLLKNNKKINVKSKVKDKKKNEENDDLDEENIGNNIEDGKLNLDNADNTKEDDLNLDDIEDDDDLDLDDNDTDDIEDDDNLDLDDDDTDNIEDDDNLDLDDDDTDDIDDDDLDLDDDDTDDVDDDDLDLDDDDTDDVDDDDLDLDDDDTDDVDDDDLDLDDDDTDDVDDDDLDLDDDNTDDVDDDDLDLDDDDTDDVDDDDLDLDDDDSDLDDDDTDDIDDNDLDLDDDDIDDIDDDELNLDDDDTDDADDDVLNLSDDDTDDDLDDKKDANDNLTVNNYTEDDDIFDLDDNDFSDNKNVESGVSKNEKDDDEFIFDLDDDEEDTDNSTDVVNINDTKDDDDEADILNLDDDDLKVDDNQIEINNEPGQFSGIRNKNYNPNYDISRKINEINGNIDNEDTEAIKKIIIPDDKKIAAFVGTHGNGTSFVINNLALLLSEQGIKTAIIDLTKNKNSYYIFTQNEERLRGIAYSCFEKLKSGISDGIAVNKNLTVYTSLPNADSEIENKETAINTLLSEFSLILFDCDIETNQEYFEIAQDIYLVQSLDVLTIQPLTAFLKKLKMNKLLNEEKLKIIINKDLRVNKLNERILISAMSVYNSPDTTYQLDLFNRDKIGYLTIPFEEKNYSKYLDELAECKLTIRGYSKNLINSFNKLAKFVYPINGKKRK